MRSGAGGRREKAGSLVVYAGEKKKNKEECGAGFWTPGSV